MPVTSRNIIVSVSDAQMSNDPDSTLVTYSLGSCIAATFYDPATRIGGMVHYQLPCSSMDTQRAQRDPFMFADTGMKLLLDHLAAAGADKRRMIVKLAGGAAMENGPKGFEIGNRNFLSARKVLWQFGLMIKGQDVGGNMPRNMYLDIATGEVTVKANGTQKAI
jgi:chemotaxis protein CheD